MIKAGADVNIIDKQGRTPCLEASGLGSVQFYQALVTTGADVVVTMDKKQRTASLEASRAGVHCPATVARSQGPHVRGLIDNLWTAQIH